MAFWGKSFIFNGIPCETFDLMLYDIGGDTQGEGSFSNISSIDEEYVGDRWRPYFYGVRYERKQTIEIVFGVNQKRIDNQKYLDRYELDAISSWLAGHKKYMWLEIEQNDMEYVRYRCMVSDLSIVSFGNIPWALRATITCDSPYAYLYPQEFKYTINGTSTIEFYNESSHNGNYYPEIDITFSSGNSFSIVNTTDDNKTMSFSGVPTTIRSIHINNDTCVITTPSGANAYPYFNFQFLRLKNGYNTLHVTGNGTLTIKCEFPISTGG